MSGFFDLIYNFFVGVFDVLNNAVFSYGPSSSDTTSIGSVLFAAIVIGFVASIFWKGAKSQ